jgi:hypothetical protein
VRQRHVGDRHDARPAHDFDRVAIAVAEGIELFHVVEVEPGLGLYPLPQAAFQAVVPGRIERAVRQPCAGRIDDQHPRLLVGNRHDNRSQVDDRLFGIRAHG